MNEYSNEEHYIRSEFEKCLGMCGLHYCTDRLWQEHITWEMDRNEVSKASNIYYRLLRIPSSKCLKHFFEFQEFIFQTSLEECFYIAKLVRTRNMVIQSFGTNHNRRLSNYDTLPLGEVFQQETEMTQESITSTH